MRKYLQKDDSLIIDDESIDPKEVIDPIEEVHKLKNINAQLIEENKSLKYIIEECNQSKKCIEEHRNQLLKKFELIDFITKNY
jgi:hypothetical protein